MLEAVIGKSIETLDIQDPLIQRNALAVRVDNSEVSRPPIFLLHGQQDTVLPVSSSVRMCYALAGKPNARPASRLDPSTGTLRKISSCGNDGGELHLIADGEHVLDYCIAEELCLAGSAQSAALTAESISDMRRWISETNPISGL